MPPSPPLAPYPWLDVVIILVLVALNGVFAMSELAIVSSRKTRLKAMARAGRRGAQTALDLAADPGRFLSTVQIGITLIGILAGAYSGASLGGPTGDRLAMLGIRPDTAQTLGFALVIFVTTYASLVIGELVPKQFALRSPEPIAVTVALPMRWLSRATAPFVWLLDKTSSLIFRLLRMNRESEDHVTAEDLQLVVAEAATAGVLEESERALISSVVRLADRPTREVMTPRTEVSWIDADAGQETIRQKLIEAPHNRIPVAEGSVDRLIGVVQARDVVSCLLKDQAIDLRALMKTAPIVPDQIDAMDAMTVLRDSEVPMAFVHDEYGHFEGIVTPGNLLNALAGPTSTPIRRSSSARTAAGGCRARSRPMRWPTPCASTCPTTATMPPPRALLCRCSSTCPRWASASPTAAGSSRYRTWTGARSTNCWRARRNGGGGGRVQWNRPYTLILRKDRTRR